MTGVFMSTSKHVVKFTVIGEPASKANSRQIVKIRGKPAVIKSAKERNYERDFRLQCPKLRPPVEFDVSVTITIYYATRRPDLDEWIILDCMQAIYKKDKRLNVSIMVDGGIYKHDRQVKEKHIYWQLDKANPRAEILVERRSEN